VEDEDDEATACLWKYCTDWLVDGDETGASIAQGEMGEMVVAAEARAVGVRSATERGCDDDDNNDVAEDGDTGDADNTDGGLNADGEQW
jgi:hypothetical protein